MKPTRKDWDGVVKNGQPQKRKRRTISSRWRGAELREENAWEQDLRTHGRTLREKVDEDGGTRKLSLREAEERES